MINDIGESDPEIYSIRLIINNKKRPKIIIETNLYVI